MTSSTIRVRSATADDAEAIRAIYAPIVETTAISFEEVPPSVEEMAGRIVATLERYPFLVAERSGRVVGYACAGQHRARAAYRWSVDVSAYVTEEARGLGVGSVLYGALLSDLASREFHAAFAGIALPNAASVAFHASMGFEPVGIYREVGFKFGRWHDVGWWQSRL